jgi:hypothetical protein
VIIFYLECFFKKHYDYSLLGFSFQFCQVVQLVVIIHKFI